MRIDILKALIENSTLFVVAFLFLARLLRWKISGRPVTGILIQGLVFTSCGILAILFSVEVLPGVLIDNGQNAEWLVIMSPFKHKVVRPEMVLVLGSLPDTGAVIEPQATPFRLFLRHFQPLLTPNSLDSFMIHSKPFLP